MKKAFENLLALSVGKVAIRERFKTLSIRHSLHHFSTRPVFSVRCNPLIDCSLDKCETVSIQAMKIACVSKIVTLRPPLPPVSIQHQLHSSRFFQEISIVRTSLTSYLRLVNFLLMFAWEVEECAARSFS